MSRQSDYNEGFYAEQAREIGKALGRDNAAKQRIVSRSPGVFQAMDTEELGAASAAELATRELKELGITAKNSDPVELLDAHHSGRQWARERVNGKLQGVSIREDVMDSADSFVDKYLTD